MGETVEGEVDGTGGELTPAVSEPSVSAGRMEIKPLAAEPEPEAAVVGFQLSFWWLLGLFVSFRWLALLLLRPGGYIRDWSDFDTFLGIASMSDYGLYPFLDFWLEWPPLVPWMAVGAYKLSLLIPPWPDDPRLWFVLILGTVFVLFEGGNLFLMHRIAGLVYSDRKEGRTQHNSTSGESRDETDTDVNDQALRPVWLYALLFVPLYTLLGFFDAVALFFLLLALYLAIRDRLLSSAAATAMGFVAKITPIVFLPVAIRRIWDTAHDGWTKIQDCALYVVGCLLSVVILLSPFLFTQPAWLLAMVRAIAGRSSWETVWALMEGYSGFGVVAGDRLNAAESGFAVHGSSLPWWLITLAFGLLYLIAWTRPADYKRPRNVVALTGFTMTLFVLYSKGFSPQFLVYVLPFIVLLFPNRRGVVYCLLLTALNVLEQPIYFVLVPEVKQLFVLVMVMRWLVWGALLLEFSFFLWGSSWRLLPVVRRYAPVALSVLLVFGLVPVAAVAAGNYFQQRLAQEPAAPVIGYLETEAAASHGDLVLLTDREMLRRVTPFLTDKYRLRLVGGASEYPGAPSLAELTAGNTAVWLLVGGEGVPENYRTELSGLGAPEVSYRFDAGYSLSLFAEDNNTSAVGPLARLSNGADLIGYHVEMPAADTLLVTLYWMAADPPNQSYTAFVHLNTQDGEFVAGHDSFPVNGVAPTQTWQAGHVYADPHLIAIPGDISPASYRLMAGMYDVNMNRAVATDSTASLFPDRVVPLGDIGLH